MIDSFFQARPADPVAKATTPPDRPHHKHIWATLAGKDIALARLAQHVTARDGAHIHDRVALCDGYEPLQRRLTEQFPTFTLIPDFIHADEYLWAVANSLMGETHPDRLPWTIDQTLKILSSQTDQVIASFQRLAQDEQYTSAQRNQLTKTADYFQRNLASMDYATYLQRGWPSLPGSLKAPAAILLKTAANCPACAGPNPARCLILPARNGDVNFYDSFYRPEALHSHTAQPPRALAQPRRLTLLAYF